MVEAFVVDASVVAKWFNKGESDEEEALLVRIAWISGKIELYSPSLLIYEVCNSIWKNPNIGRDQASSLSKLAIRLSPTLLGVGEDESFESMNLARKSKLTFYDAVYIVLSKIRKQTLLSADEDQLDISRDLTKSAHISKVRNLLAI